MALEQQGRYAEAAESWRAVAEKNPRDATAFAGLGLDLARQGDYPGAVEAYRKALKLDAHIRGLELDLGLALFKQGQELLRDGAVGGGGAVSAGCGEERA